MLQKEYILTLSCQDTIGIVAAVTGFLAKHELFILELSQCSDSSTGQFFMRVDFKALNLAEKESDFRVNFKAISEKFGMKFEIHNKAYKSKILILASKEGHCLNDLLHRVSSGNLMAEVSAVFSNHETLKTIVSRYDFKFKYLPVDKNTRKTQEKIILDYVTEQKIDLVVLARYMQILSSDFCQKLQGKIINIHHSFLPSFAGAKPYHQAFDRGVKLIGATAHYVTKDLDEGQIIDQETIRVRHDHSPSQLVKMGQNVESAVLARAVKYHVEQRVIINNNKTVVFD